MLRVSSKMLPLITTLLDYLFSWGMNKIRISFKEYENSQVLINDQALAICLFTLRLGLIVFKHVTVTSHKTEK